MGSERPWDAAFDQLVRSFLDFQALERDKLGGACNEGQFPVELVGFAEHRLAVDWGVELLRDHRLVDFAATGIAGIGCHHDQGLDFRGSDDDSLAFHQRPDKFGSELPDGQHFVFGSWPGDNKHRAKLTYRLTISWWPGSAASRSAGGCAGRYPLNCHFVGYRG